MDNDQHRVAVLTVTEAVAALAANLSLLGHEPDPSR